MWQVGRRPGGASRRRTGVGSPTLHNIDGLGSPPQRRSTGDGGFCRSSFSVFSQLCDPPEILIMMREVHIPNRSIYLSSSTTVQWLIAPNRRPFLGVTYGLRAGFILRPRAGLAGRAPNVRRVVYARRYSQVGRWVVW